MKKHLTSLAALVASVAIVFASGPAAYAAPTPGTLAAGNTLFAYDCDGDISTDLLSVDVATGATTPVGTSNIGSCWSGAAYNEADGLTYVVNWNEVPWVLSSVNTSTGVFTDIGPLKDGAIEIQPYVLAIGKTGDAYAIAGAGPSSILYSIDLTSGNATQIGVTNIPHATYSAAINPVDGVLYVLEYSDFVSSDIYSVNLTDASSTLVFDNYTSVTNGRPSEGLAFDSNGTAWLEIDGTNADIWSADIADFGNTAQFETLLYQPGDPTSTWYAETISITRPAPAPVLPNTGQTASVGIVLGGTTLAVLGAGIVLLARRRTA